MEQEVMGLLIGGFAFVIILALITIAILWFENKHFGKAYAWTALHFVVLSLAVSFLLKAMAMDYNPPMASEEISIQLGWAGFTWAASIACLLMGVKEFSKK